MANHWSTHQITEYLVSVSYPQDPAAAIVVALECAAEALDAEFAVAVIDGEIRGQVGFGRKAVPDGFVTAQDGATVQVPKIGAVHLASGELDRIDHFTGGANARVVVGRVIGPYTAEEHQMLHGMALVLGLVLRNLETLQSERQRRRLVETLLAIQRAISARRPLTELLDGITAGASALLGGCPVTLLLADPLSPGELVQASMCDFPELDRATLTAVRQVLALDGPVPAQRSALDASIPHQPGPAEPDSDLAQSMLVEQVVVANEAAGCLVALPGTERVQGQDPAELLTAFAQQVNLALTDAKTLDAVREARHDSITGLPNRALFLDRLGQQRHLALSNGQELTVLFIDLDRFKAVNDTLGHAAGDELLAEVARRILTCIGSEDTVARLGGDEFAVLLPNVDARIGSAAAGRIISALSRTFALSGREVIIGASVGIASMTADQDGASALLSDADVAMYCAKRAGRGHWVVFEPQMHTEVADRLSLRTDLQGAWAQGQLWLAYQPIVGIGTRRTEGVEVLMRWNHPTRGAVPPSEFIPIAEESDSILTLGAWALRQSLAQVAQWRIGSPSLQLSVNVSARQIVDPGLPGVIEAALGTLDFPAGALTLEVTESLLMNDPDLARTRLRALKDLGVRLAIDDFGTGYSSLAYLRQFPVDQVKVDRSFVSGLTAGAHDAIAVVRSVLELCQSLRLQTVAEGIEGPEQLEILADLGCDLGQGYLFARPMPPQSWPAPNPARSGRRG